MIVVQAEAMQAKPGSTKKTEEGQANIKEVVDDMINTGRAGRHWKTFDAIPQGRYLVSKGSVR
jgi:hypothetical protein